MNAAEKELRVKATAPSAQGTFDGTILYNPESGDSDGERINSWTNLPTTVPLHYQHAKGDGPIGTITATLIPGGRLMSVHGQLDLSNPIGKAVHERMTLPSADPMVLNELSVGYLYDLAANTKDVSGVVAIHGAELSEVSIVRAGAQATAISNVKERTDDGSKELDDYSRILDALSFEPPASDSDLVAALDALDPPAPSPQEHREMTEALTAHAEREMYRRGMDDPRWTDAYSPEDMVGPVTPEEVERDRARTDSRYRVQSDGPVPFEAVDLIDALREDERVHRDDEAKLQADFAREQMNVEREIAERARWEDAYSPDDLMRPAAAPDPEEPTTIRLPIPS